MTSPIQQQLRSSQRYFRTTQHSLPLQIQRGAPFRALVYIIQLPGEVLMELSGLLTQPIRFAPTMCTWTTTVQELWVT